MPPKIENRSRAGTITASMDGIEGRPRTDSIVATPSVSVQEPEGVVNFYNTKTKPFSFEKNEEQGI